jgi:phospholipase A1
MESISVFYGKHLTAVIVVFFLLLTPVSYLQAEDCRSLPDCSRIENEEERLACYDKIAREEPRTDDSYLSRQWELDETKSRNSYAIMTHRSNYILPVAYNKSPNKRPFKEDSDGGGDAQETEVKFQISLKIKLWQDILGRDMDLWFGYTQQSFWQVYNFDDSSPFRETNYEPELLLNIRTNFDLLRMNARVIQVGLNHESNGRSGPFSRGWNRIVGNLGLEKGDFTLLLKAWHRIPASEDKDDNPDIDDYMGYGEIWAYYLRDGYRLGAMLRNNLKHNDNRGALQLECSIPVSRNIGIYIQYFNGYGESLLDYNHNVNRISAGFIVTGWN